MFRTCRALAFAATLAPSCGHAQSALNMIALQGLAAFSVLPNTPAGKAALAANLAVTGGIQTGALKQPSLLPLPDQQAQALQDGFITGANAAQLSDALGTALATAYQARANYQSPTAFTAISPAVTALLAYAAETTAADSNAGKYFFANGTTDGTTAVANAATSILTDSGGLTDVYGRAYGLPAGSPGADPFGDSRPYQTEPTLLTYRGRDYFGQPSDSKDYLWGPAQDLLKSPAFPSGHTTYGYTESLLLGILVPQRYQQEITRGAEYGNDRIVLGAHYAMDVIGGRTIALHDLAHLLANDPAYVGQPKARAPVVVDFQAALKAARADLQAALQAGCGGAVAVCAANDNSRFRDPEADEAFYESTQTYGLPAVHPNTEAAAEDVAKVAPEAGYLLTAAFPTLSLAAADDILTATEGPGGGFLDDGSAFGLYSRLDLYAAVKNAAARATKP